MTKIVNTGEDIKRSEKIADFIRDFEKIFLTRHSEYNLYDITIDYNEKTERAYVGLILKNKRNYKTFIQKYYDECKKTFSDELMQGGILNIQICNYCVLLKKEIVNRENIYSFVERKTVSGMRRRFIEKHCEYKLLDLVIHYFYIDESADIALILKTEKDKAVFIEKDYEKCKSDLISELKNNDVLSVKECSFKVFSKEEIDEKYEGIIYYAML